MGEFEKDLQKLEDISQKLQSGEMGIEKSMELYAEGVRLANALSAKLEKYKSKIEILETEVKE
ncbi:MAG: exodeoxyribonuclease VII small subunit [Eubacteriales bacterium]|nr:exodeoxyribonuclease VII small subunit [Eubacteriales bacterium]